MRDGIWLCNVPREDYEKLKNTLYATLQIGEPKHVRGEISEDCVGLYTTAKTPTYIYEMLMVNRPKRKKRHKKEIFVEETSVLEDEPIEKNVAKTPVNDDDEINLLDLLDD